MSADDSEATLVITPPVSPDLVPTQALPYKRRGRSTGTDLHEWEIAQARLLTQPELKRLLTREPFRDFTRWMESNHSTDFETFFLRSWDAFQKDKPLIVGLLKQAADLRTYPQMRAYLKATGLM